MAVFFLLLMLVVQIGFAVTARSMVAASVEAATRRLAWAPDNSVAEMDRLTTEISATVPGADIVDTRIQADASNVTVEVRYRWLPPGPDLMPIEVVVTRTRTLAIPP
jgi:hypothetical protein